MTSEADMSETPLIERLIISRNRDLSDFEPFLLGLTNTRRELQDPDEVSSDSPHPRDRIILINPRRQEMIIIEGSSNLDSLINNLSGKKGQPPASKSSIEAMPDVEITEDGGECVICLEDWWIGELAKEMPCKHMFHGECIGKWLGIHGSCPVCRHTMPVDEESVDKKRHGGSERDGDGDGDDDEERGRRGEREILASLPFLHSADNR